MPKRAGASALIFIFITVLLNMIGVGVIMPVMPQLIIEVTGEDLAHAAQWGGTLTFVYALMQFIMMPIIGGLSDRFGRRPVLLVSLFAYSIDFLVMALAPTIMLIAITRMAAGAFAATFSTANAYIADISPPEKRAANFGLVGAAFGLGFIIGPAIGGALGGAYGPRAPFFFVAAIGALNFLFGVFVLPETLGPEKRRKFEWRRANAVGNFKQFAKYPVMVPIAMVLFIAQIAHWSYPAIWAYYAIEKFGWSAFEIAASLSFVGLTAAIVQGGLTRIVIPKIGERRAAIFAMSVTFISYMAFAYVETVWLVYALIAFSSLGGFAQPALQGIMSRTMPDNAQGELQGAVAAVMSIAMVISPWVMTQIFAAFSDPGAPVTIFGVQLLATGAPFYFPGAPFVVAASLEIIAIAFLFMAFARIRRPRDETPSTGPDR